MTSSADRVRDAVIFDLDGTLVDSLPDLMDSLNHLLGEHARRALSADAVRVMIGDGAAVLVERGFEATGGMPADPDQKLLARFLELYEPRAAEKTRAWAGVVDALVLLRTQGCHLAVCTNKPYKATIEILDALNLTHYFDAVIGGDSTPHKKPDPTPLLAAIEGMGAAPPRAVMIGDSANDVEVARRAGIPVIVVSFGYTRIPARELGANAVIDTFAELAEALDRMH